MFVILFFSLVFFPFAVYPEERIGSFYGDKQLQKYNDIR